MKGVHYPITGGDNSWDDEKDEKNVWVHLQQVDEKQLKRLKLKSVVYPITGRENSWDNEQIENIMCK